MSLNQAAPIGGGSMPSANAARNLAGAGGYSQSMYPRDMPVRDRVHFEVENVENGYILRYGYEGLIGRTYICATAEELAQRIIASMVINKMEK